MKQSVFLSRIFILILALTQMHGACHKVAQPMIDEVARGAINCNAWNIAAPMAPPAVSVFPGSIEGFCFGETAVPWPTNWCVATYCSIPKMSPGCHCVAGIGTPRVGPVSNPGVVPPDTNIGPIGIPVTTFFTSTPASFGDDAVTYPTTSPGPASAPSIVSTTPNVPGTWIAPATQPLTIRFDRRIDPTTLQLSGSLVNSESAPIIAVSQSQTYNDTISLTPSSNWPTGFQTLTVKVQDLDANQSNSTLSMTVGNTASPTVRVTVYNTVVDPVFGPVFLLGDEFAGIGQPWPTRIALSTGEILNLPHSIGFGTSATLQFSSALNNGSGYLVGAAQCEYALGIFSMPCTCEPVGFVVAGADVNVSMTCHF